MSALSVTAQAGQPDSHPGQTGRPLGIGAGGGDGHPELAATVDLLLEGEGRADDAAVELGEGDAHGHIQRGQTDVVAGPLVARSSARRRLEHGDAEIGQMGHVPGVGIIRRGAAHGQHGGDEHVDASAQLQGGHGSVGVGAQRIAEDAPDVGAGLVEGGRQVLDEGGVAGDEMGPVEDDADEGPARPSWGGAGLEHPGRRHLGRRVEPEAGEQDGVGDKAQAGLHVGRAAGRQVVVDLGGDAGRDRRSGRQLGIRCRLAADRDQGHASGQAPVPELVEGSLPRLLVPRGGGR